MWSSRDHSGRPGWRPILKGSIAASLLLLVAAAPAAGAWPLGRASDAVGATNAVVQAAGASKVYVGLFKDDAVAVLDVGTHQVLTTIVVPPGPHGLVAAPDGRQVFVSSDGASTVSVIDTAADAVIDTVEVGPTPHGLAISPDGRTVLVSGFGANQAEVIDTSAD